MVLCCWLVFWVFDYLRLFVNVCLGTVVQKKVRWKNIETHTKVRMSSALQDVAEGHVAETQMSRAALTYADMGKPQLFMVGGGDKGCGAMGIMASSQWGDAE